MGPEPVWIGAENLTPTGIRSPDLPARSESLYRLSYPGSTAKKGRRKWCSTKMRVPESVLFSVHFAPVLTPQHAMYLQENIPATNIKDLSQSVHKLRICRSFY